MKNRKTVVVAFMLVAVMLLGVGYAAITDVLDIQGTAEVTTGNAQKELDNDIYFTGIKDSDGSFKTNVNVKNGDATLYTAQINSDNNDKASFTVSGLGKAGDFVEITYKIVNDGDAGLDAQVTPKLQQNSNPEFFEITTKDGWTNWSAQEIKAGNEKTITIIVTLLKTPTTVQATSINIELKAVSTTNDPVVTP